MRRLSDIFKARAFSSLAASPGAIIFGCVVLSMLVANSPFSKALNDLLDVKLGFRSSVIDLKYSLLQWVNDGLMAIFFLLIGLDIKRELVRGELSIPSKALLPVFCAIGGAIVPAVIYFLFNKGQLTESGWGIPMATDIAFALAVINLLKKDVPASLKVFLSAVAVVDDLMAILVIAIFYSNGIHGGYLLGASGIIVVLFVLNRLKVQRLVFYLVPGIFMWYFIHHSGIHATIAGVVTAMFIPLGEEGRPSPLERLEHILYRPVNLLIVPVFAFCNTNIHFEPGMADGLLSRLGLGIIVGLMVGKPLGILGVSFIGTKTGIFRLPEKAVWRHMLGVGLLAGIGFTMSIFIALLSFEAAPLIAASKFAILCGSLLSAILGYLVLKFHKRRSE